MSAPVLTAQRSQLGLAALPEAAEEVFTRVDERARAVDRGEADCWQALRELGRIALLDARLPEQVEVIHALARRDVASAFSTWGHRSGIEYLDATGTARPDGVESGDVVLASGMAPAFKESAGLGEVPIAASAQQDGDLALSGVLPWCSNLREGAHIVLPTRLEDGGRAIVRISRDAPGVTVKPLTGLTALDGTSSGVLKLDGAVIGAQDVLTTDVPAFLERVRAPFLLLQTAMCLGLAGAALDAAEDTADDVARTVLGADIERDIRAWDEQRDRLATLVNATTEGDAAARDVVALRLDAALLAGSATALEQKVVGGRGYALASATSRRAREAAFLPVQSPTEIHLRHVLGAAEATA